MYPFIKSVADFLISLLLIVLLSPLLILVTLLLTLQNSGKPFFLQCRPGKNQRPFSIIKFRSMHERRDSNGNLLPDNERLTPLGKLIRKTSIDELPQLFNVLKGDMSLVGPRPLLLKYIPLYSGKQVLRHLVRPGITGWAQVNGRNSISWTQKFALDVYYVEHYSFLLDLRILLLTVQKVFRREGVNQSESRPMEPFNGHN